MNYQHLLGRPFKHGSSDCYGLVRSFYKDIFNIELTNYARPDNWWDRGMNLYIEYIESEGFRQVEREMQPGDVILMAIRSVVPNHAGIYVGNNRFVHHFYNNLSVEEMFKGMWLNRKMAVYRHPEVKIEAQVGQIDLMELLPARLRERIEAAQSMQNSPAPE